jgi:hypothetical protein
VTRTIPLAAAVVLSLAPAAHAQLIAYDGFAYPTGSLDGQNGGTGFGTPWAVASGTILVQSGSLVPAAPSSGLSETGNSLSVTPLTPDVPGFATRTLGTPIVGTPGSVLWVSVVMKGSGTQGISGQGALVLSDGASGGFSITTGATGSGIPPQNPNTNADWSISDAGTGAAEASSTIPDVLQSLLVARVTFAPAGNPASDQIDLFVNPPLTGAPPATASATLLVNHAATLTTLGLDYANVDGNTTSTLYDEIRLGQTFADVTPVPEPSSILFAGLAGAALIVRQRRKKFPPLPA